MNMITKQDTVLWTNHAIARYISLGFNQKRLAEDLGLEESRLSEMKQGKKRISPNQISQIQDLCGSPQVGKGRFEHAIIYNSVNDFLLLKDDLLEQDFYLKIINAFSRIDYKENLFNALIIDTKFFNEDSNKEIAISNWINNTLQLSTFQEHCQLYKESLKTRKMEWGNDWINKNQYYEFRDKDCLTINNLTITYRSIFHSLYLLWLVYNHDNNYKFNSDCYQHNINKQKIPTIISGKCILVFKKYNSEVIHSSINKKIFDKFGSEYLDSSSYFGYDDDNEDKHSMMFNSHERGKLEPFLIKDIRAELYLSESMNYHLLIHISTDIIGFLVDSNCTDLDSYEAESYVEDLSDMVFIIPNINPLTLSNDMEEIRKWIGLSSDKNYQLYKEIARSGGYIPGTKVLR